MRDLSYSLGTEVVIYKLSMSVKENEIMGLLGGNGSGKTTLINVLLGNINPARISNESSVLL